MSVSKLSASEMPINEQHVSSLIVYIAPNKINNCKSAIPAINGAELITITNQGKAIVVVEGNSQKAIMQCIDHINEVQGVLSTNLVYHQFEQAM